MSCQIRLSANIHDIAAIRRCLFPTDDHRGTDNWLQNIEASVSPTGDIIALGNDRRLVILTSKWDSSLSISQFLVTYSGSIHEYDKIKAVICLPIVGQSQSSHVGPDWTCIMIGYDSGFVRFYTENCELLYEEQLHIENITSITCQSQHSPRPDISPNLHPEEIYVQYQSNVCVISGPLLFQHLRACRSQLARVQAKGDILDMPHFNLNLKKWGFQEQATINKSAVVGLNLSSTFDHLLTASTCGGFDSKYRAIAPHNTLVMAVGSKPFVGYHYALEGGAQPVFSDVAKAVASKLKSALPGWLTGNKAPQEKQMTVAMQPAEAMGCRFGLCDLRRTASDIILSPDRKLAAVSDALGRVSLIDAYRGVTLRIFKGYRDAQMSFIQVPDERKSKHKIGNRVALFLIIYSSRKGTLEIFSVQQGTKIATFTASKHSRLLYIDYGLMGFVTTSKSKYICQYTTVFVDSDGQIKEIQIPFHFALTEKNNKRAKDLHLYKKLRALIKSGDFDNEKLSVEAKNTYTELKTSEIRLQTVDLLLNNKDVPAEISLECVEYFIEKFKEEPELEDNNLKVLVTNACCLLKLFMFLKLSTNLDAENGNSDAKLDIPTKELGNLQKLLDLSAMSDNMKKTETRVKFVDDNTSLLQDFSSVFNLTEANRISLKENLEDQQILKASEVAFKKYITGTANNYDDLQEKIVESRIVIKDLFYLLVFYWVNRTLYMHLDLEREMGNLSSVIYCIVRAENKEEVLTDYNGVSKFWSEVRDILALSSRPFPALTAAILCRNIAQKYDFENDMDKSVTSFEDDSVLEDNIEVLSQENILWSILIGKLEDVSLLNIILSNDPIASDCPLPKLSHEKVDVCLRYVLQKGRGAVSELVAKWLTKCGINPRNIVINDYIYQKSLEDEENVKEAVEDETIYTLEELEYVKAQPVFDHINRLKSQFPYNLETSNLLANLCWEYALAWHKDIQLLENLEASVRCLGSIPNLRIQHGLFNLVWNTHIKIVYESACKLINKVGKLPKERLCRQDTGLSDYQITQFITISTEFLDSFLDIAEKSFKEPKVVLKFEPIWDNGSQPLVQLAVDQRNVNYDLLHLHYQLSLILQMITTFAIKHSKPVSNLFDISISGLFFTDLQRQQQITSNRSDIKINSSRTQFLLKIISASLESVSINEDGKIYSSEHVKWMAKCLDLARIWNLEVDVFRRYQVVQLYASGFDQVAEELLPAINNKTELGTELLSVAAKRMSQFLASSPKLSENISAFSPVLTRYLDSIVGDWCSPSSLESIATLANHAFLCLTEDQHEYKIVYHLLEACKTLEDIQ